MQVILIENYCLYIFVGGGQVFRMTIKFSAKTKWGKNPKEVEKFFKKSK